MFHCVSANHRPKRPYEKNVIQNEKKVKKNKVNDGQPSNRLARALEKRILPILVRPYSAITFPRESK